MKAVLFFMSTQWHSALFTPVLYPESEAHSTQNILVTILTMVTNTPYYSFKDLRARRSAPFAVLVLAVLLIALVSAEPATVLFVLFVAYALSGYVVYGWRKAKGQYVSIVSTSTDEPDEQGLHPHAGDMEHGLLLADELDEPEDAEEAEAPDAAPQR